MSFNTSPKPGPNIANPPGASARDRAIAMLTKGAPEAHPVRNPTQVAPEEMGAISPKSEEEEPKQDLGQSDTVESASESTQEAPKVAEEAPLSPQYAVLARKEKALRAQVQKLNAEREAFKAEQDAFKASSTAPAFDPSKYIPKDKLADKSNLWSTLSELGVTYDDLTQMALNPPQQQDPRTMSMIEEMRAEIKALKGETEGTKKSFQDQQQQSYQQAVNQIKSEAKQLVYSSADFETIRETNSVSDVVELIEETFKSEGVLLSVEEAAREVEEHLVEEAMKIARLKKIQSRLKPQEPPKQQEAAPKQQQPMKTLTNSVSASRPLTPKERAILAFKGELKN